MTDALPVLLNRRILAAANGVFESQLSPEQRRCVARLINIATIEIDENSRLAIAGDLRVAQTARLAFQCADSLTEQQRQTLSDAIVDAADDVLNRQLSDAVSRPTRAQLRAIVNDVLQRRAERCPTRPDGNGIAIAPGVRIRGSDFQVGACDRDEIQRLSDACTDETARQQFDGPGCTGLVECAKSDATLTLLASNVDLSTGDCPQLDEIAFNIVDAIALLNPSDDTPREANNDGGITTVTILLIALGVFLVLFLVFLIWFFATRRRKDDVTRYRPTSPPY